jgi:hypothetical protein
MINLFPAQAIAAFAECCLSRFDAPWLQNTTQHRYRAATGKRFQKS